MMSFPDDDDDFLPRNIGKLNLRQGVRNFEDFAKPGPSGQTAKTKAILTRVASAKIPSEINIQEIDKGPKSKDKGKADKNVNRDDLKKDDKMKGKQSKKVPDVGKEVPKVSKQTVDLRKRKESVKIEEQPSTTSHIQQSRKLPPDRKN